MTSQSASVEKKPSAPMNIIVCQDMTPLHQQMQDIVSELNKQGHDATFKGVVHVSELIKLLDEEYTGKHSRLPTDILMDVSGGNGAPGAGKVIEWFKKNHPDAPLPTFNFLSLSVDMAITDASKLRIDTGRIMASAVSSEELGWVQRHMQGKSDMTRLPETNTLRRLLNDKLDLGLPLEQKKNGHYIQKLGELETLANRGIASEWARGNIPSELAIESLRKYFGEMSAGLQSSYDESAGPLNFDLKTDASFYGATGLPQKGKVVFNAKQAEEAFYNRQNPILVMNGYDPSVVPLLANRMLGGIVVTSTYMASHLKLLCDTYGVSGLFGVAPKGQRALKDEFNEEAQLRAPAFFEGEKVTIDGHEIKRGQDILVSFDDNGLVLNPPAELKTRRPESKRLGIEEHFRVKTMLRCFSEFFAEKGLQTTGVKANISSARDGKLAAPNGIGLVRTEQMVASNMNLLSRLKKVLLNSEDEKAYRDLFSNSAYEYMDIIRQLDNGPVKIRLFDFVHEEILNKEEQKEFLNKYKKLDIHGGEALATFPLLYKEQVKTIFRALKDARVSSGRPLEIMMPAVRTKKAVLEIKNMIKAEAAAAGIKPEQYSFGIMAETLEACKKIDIIAPHCDFISFGTNDLTQQHTGMGRGDLKAHAVFAKKHGYDPFKTLAPEVLEIVRDTVARGRAVNPSLRVDICGAQAANADAAIKLMEAGIDNVSVAPTPANIYGLPLQLNYRLYDALKQKQRAPSPKRAQAQVAAL